jgi:predicted GTPase
MTTRRKTVILGAAGRDFHNFNVRYRTDESVEVLAFTATQIPNIEGRIYPPSLAGPLYPEGIPIVPDTELPQLVRESGAEVAVFAYSDVSHEQVMHVASQVNALGADFHLLGASSTMIPSRKPVVAVCAVRTGSGKSQTTRRIVSLLKEMGRRVAVIRHPMPYGDLARQAVQRFGEYGDLDRHECTIEEREEYEHHLARDSVVFAGIDYAAILAEAEKEADVVVWDGGNNDTPFYRPRVHVTVADPHRAGHELRYHPGETNLIMADVIVINKMDSAPPEKVEAVRASIRDRNPGAVVIEADSPVTVEHPERIAGKRVLCVEDGPTLTHGEMAYGAAVLAARRAGAAEIIDPRPFAVGTIAGTFRTYPDIGTLLPAMGYGDKQMQDLKETIDRSDADLVLVGTPIDLARVVEFRKPSLRVTYELRERGTPDLGSVLRDRLSD